MLIHNTAFSDDVNSWLQTCLNNGIFIGFVCDDESQNLLFHAETGNVIADILLMQRLAGELVGVNLKDQQVEIIYNIPDDYYLLVIAVS